MVLILAHRKLVFDEIEQVIEFTPQIQIITCCIIHIFILEENVQYKERLYLEIHCHLVRDFVMIDVTLPVVHSFTVILMPLLGEASGVEGFELLVINIKHLLVFRLIGVDEQDQRVEYNHLDILDQFKNLLWGLLELIIIFILFVLVRIELVNFRGKLGVLKVSVLSADKLKIAFAKIDPLLGEERQEDPD